MAQLSKDFVAVVAGATRGSGRGIAVQLGAAGATVYCTGRSTKSERSDIGRPETIEETAELVTSAGGHGIAVRCDHSVESDVKALFDRIEEERGGRLDLLVNDVWGGDHLTEWGKKFWEIDTSKAFTLMQRAVHTHILTSRHGVPLMVKNGKGLVIEVTDGNTSRYRDNLPYDMAKASVIRLGFGMNEELKSTGVTALTVTPGFLRSEAMLDIFGVTKETWRDHIVNDPYWAESETPTFIGRAVAALAADSNVAAKGGKAWATWDLAKEYEFDDEDGSRPDWGTKFAEFLAKEAESKA